MRTDALLFGESQSRILVTVDKTDLETLLILAQEFGIPANILGKTGGDRLIFFHKNKKVIDTAVKDAFDIWEQSIPDFFEAK
jgi:phosphoribosylformylglycinamidine synthase